MSILTATGVGLSHGAFDVFSGISLSIPQDARIGLVGPNGIGKTTLLRILAGVIAPTTGNVQRARDRKLGYLRQEAVEAFAARDHSVYAEMLTVFAHLQEQASRLEAMEARMAAGEHGDDLVAAYGIAQEAFEHGGGYDYDVRIQQVLEGLGFPQLQWETPLSHLSGGQKTRALLARLLLEAPDLLILDEPSNHLDMQAIEWLEKILRNWNGSLLVVSHDRYFLDKVVDRIYEMSRIDVEMYRGNYSDYVRQRQERWERRQRLFEETKERLEKEMVLIRRYIAWRKFDEAKGKLKRLSRELAAIAELGVLGVQGKSWSETGVGGVSSLSVEEAHQKVKALRPDTTRPPTLSMHLKAHARSGTIVLRTSGLQVGYPGKPLFSAADIDLHRQDCAALIGPNGAGKTTFLRTILGQLAPLAGEVTLGASLHVGYFAQAHEALNPDSTVIDELLNRRTMGTGEARDYLARYLFRGDDVWKKVGALSGGERGRLALALLALDGANFLLLDEPTNHLDIPAQEVLQEGLDHFEGTLLLVSHDRYLVDRLATQIWELRDGRLHVFKGPYQEFLAAREREVLHAKEEVALAQVPVTPPINGNGAASSKGARKRAQALEQVETRITELEALLVAYSEQLQKESEALQYLEVKRLAQLHHSTQTQLDALMTEWAALGAE